MPSYRFGQDFVVRNYYVVEADDLELAKAKLKADPETYFDSQHPDEEELDPNVNELMHSDYMATATLIEEIPDDD